MTPELDRCGWMREGCDLQCRLESGHNEIHAWESEAEMLERIPQQAKVEQAKVEQAEGVE